mmetsp:Transcript_11280/g.18944  ORF Transcript_11280/g.18944 Transcript_11280/m.18944 type:complete len:487 (-) Transcript_11280:289-1749(-)
MLLVTATLALLSLFSAEVVNGFQPNVQSLRVSRLAAMNNAGKYGLLYAMEDVSNAQYYSRNIPVEHAAQLVKNSNVLFDAALADCDGNTEMVKEYLKSIELTMETFDNNGTVWDRGELISALTDTFEKKGQLVCLLGGRSTGKSLLLQELSKLSKQLPVRKGVQQSSPKSMILYLDMRTGYSGITEGLLKVISTSSSRDLVNFALKSVREFVEDNNVKITARIVEDMISPGKSVAALSFLLNRLVDCFSKQTVTLIIDEANLPLTLKSYTSADKIEETRAVLQLLTRLTKQEKKLNVLLVSSEHVFPFRLSDPRLNFNIEFITRAIFVGEIPPKDMIRLLRDEWNIRENLALALMSIYGGQYYNAYRAIGELVMRGEDFYPFGFHDPQGILRCFKELGKDQESLVHVLEQLAVTGFAGVLDREDPVAEVLSKNNVAGVVGRSSIVVGLPRDMWLGNEYGLVPTSQTMRLRIAAKLYENNTEMGDIQ